nr:hypothetical protein [Tanacetum cinerariifolium]
MRPFSCPVTILNTLDPLGKFDGKADEGFLVGYSVSRNGPTWLFDIDTLTKSINYQSVTAGNQPNLSTGVQEHFDADKAGEGNINNICFFPYGLLVPKILITLMMILPLKLRSLSLKLRSLSLQFMFLQAVVPRQRSMMTRLKDRLKERVITPVLAVGQISTNSTNTFSDAGPSNTVVIPTLGKSSYVDPSQYPDDPNMPALEDITYSDDEENVGAEADFSNLETNITVGPILTTRVHKDHSMTQIISDLSLAPQTRSMTRMVKEQGNGPTWLFDIDTLTKSMNYQSVTAGNQPNLSTGNTDDDTTFEVKEPEFKVKEPKSAVHASQSSGAKTKKHDDKTQREAKGKSHLGCNIIIYEIT